ncbi:MAG: hypothetical protein R3E54_13510 [Halioglobus sp.]
MLARAYSALTGALTVVATVLIALWLMPGQPAVGWTAGALLALSGWHISESHSATVDAPSTFFIYLFLAVLVYASARHSPASLRLSPLLLVGAVWAKYWVFAIAAYLAWLPQRVSAYVFSGMSLRRAVVVAVGSAGLFGLLSVQSVREHASLPLVLGLWYLLIPWRRVHQGMRLVWALVPPLAWAVCQIDVIQAYTLGSESGRFGTSYAAIDWHKLPRNLLNLPLVLLVGLGLPAWLFLPAGLGAVARGPGNARAWCCLLPLAAFALFMAFVSPITYYRHYLPLLPVACIVAACGLYAGRWGRHRWCVALVLAWPVLLAIDLVGDYHHDPRIALRAFYAEHPQAAVFISYYVNPPPGNNALFRPEYAGGDAAILRRAEFLILSENWYDTAFANELNGPLVDDLTRLVKTRPAYAAFYREALAGRHPHLRPERTLAVSDVMPELLLHRYLYGSFPLFVGDIQILRVVE